MKKLFTLHLALALNILFLNNDAHALLPENAPLELKAFIESDFDSIHMSSLKTHSVPLKILIPALILEGRNQGWIGKNSYDYKTVFKRAGLNYPDNVVYDSKVYAWKSDTLPMGLVQKEMNFGIRAKIKMTNLSCVACHSGSQYNQDGQKLNNLIIGAASDTFNPEVYVESIYKGMNLISKDWKATYKMIDHLFPNTKLKEKILFKTLIKNKVNKYVKERASINRGSTFLNGGPGLTNGVSSLKSVLELNTTEGSETGFTSIPSIGDRGFRSSLLWDGVYSVANKEKSRTITKVSETELSDVASIVSLFTIPTMGKTTKRVLKDMDDVVKVIVPILKTYKTPVFPGELNIEVARRGFEVYSQNCLQCHGEYKWNEDKKSELVSFPNLSIPQNEMNSDQQRWLSISYSLLNKLEATLGTERIQFNQTEGYVAPILEGLWASAPYMHNGSVPTLWNFLRPSTRPSSFVVGNQSLDMLKIGVAGVSNSNSEIYDTSLSGRSNRGHEKEFLSLSENEKDDLLEYLKTL